MEAFHLSSIILFQLWILGSVCLKFPSYIRNNLVERKGRKLWGNHHKPLSLWPLLFSFPSLFHFLPHTLTSSSLVSYLSLLGAGITGLSHYIQVGLSNFFQNNVGSFKDSFPPSHCGWHHGKSVSELARQEAWETGPGMYLYKNTLSRAQPGYQGPHIHSFLSAAPPNPQARFYLL